MSNYKTRATPMKGLEAIIKEKGYNLHSFSVQAGLRYLNVYRWVHGIYEPSLKDVKRMANFLGVSIDDLVA